MTYHVPKRRIGKEMHRFLEMEVHPHVKVRLQRLQPSFEESMGQYYQKGLWVVIGELKEVIDECVEAMNVQCQLRGLDYYIIATASTCRRKNCGTCLGKYSTHYPYLHKYYPKTQETEQIKARDWRSFFSSISLGADWINRLYFTMDLRHQIIRDWYHYQLLYFNHLGLVTKTL